MNHPQYDPTNEKGTRPASSFSAIEPDFRSLRGRPEGIHERSLGREPPCPITAWTMEIEKMWGEFLW